MIIDWMVMNPLRIAYWALFALYLAVLFFIAFVWGYKAELAALGLAVISMVLMAVGERL